MPALRVYTSRRKQLLLLLASVLFVAASVWIFLNPDNARQELYSVAGIALFGLATVYFLVRLVRPKPAIEIDTEGITDTSSIASGGRIAWSEIRGVYIASVKGQRMLAVDLLLPDQFLARVPAARRTMLSANRNLTGAAVNIPEAALPFTLEQLISEMAQRHPSLLVGNPR